MGCNSWPRPVPISDDDAYDDGDDDDDDGCDGGDDDDDDEDGDGDGDVGDNDDDDGHCHCHGQGHDHGHCHGHKWCGRASMKHNSVRQEFKGVATSWVVIGDAQGRGGYGTGRASCSGGARTVLAWITFNGSERSFNGSATMRFL